MLTQDEVKELVHYDPETGFIVYIKEGFRQGRMLAKRNTHGYITISIKSHSITAHRLAFLYMTGSIPQCIDHINHNKCDNRWCNIRDTSQSTNMKNQPLYSSNKSGFTGVHFSKKKKKWVAQINIEGRLITLGSFKTKAEAIVSRKEANKFYGFHENHGNETKNLKGRGVLEPTLVKKGREKRLRRSFNGFYTEIETSQDALQSLSLLREQLILKIDPYHPLASGIEAIIDEFNDLLDNPNSYLNDDVLTQEEISNLSDGLEHMDLYVS